MKILLSVPFYGDIAYRTVLSILNAQDWAIKNDIDFNVQFASTSATPFCFNKHLAEAYHSDADYWVMLHADIGAKETNWIEILLNDMKRHDLSVVSAVAAIKNNQGHTSVAVNDSDVFPRRLTLTEIHEGPEVLTNEICKRIYGHSLLINTGVMVWDLSVMRDKIPDMPFEFHDYFKQEKGHLAPQFIPEDWLMSKRLDEQGIRYGATRRVGTIHKGSQEFNSFEVWGERIDSQYLRRVKDGINSNSPNR